MIVGGRKIELHRTTEAGKRKTTEGNTIYHLSEICFHDKRHAPSYHVFFHHLKYFIPMCIDGRRRRNKEVEEGTSSKGSTNALF